MIEAQRRHGHYDPRLYSDARVSHRGGRFARQRRALVPAVAADDGSSIDSWENEGGSYLMTRALDLERRAPIASVS
jgi:hypothetical protein